MLGVRLCIATETTNLIMLDNLDRASNGYCGKPTLVVVRVKIEQRSDLICELTVFPILRPIKTLNTQF